MKPHHLMIGLLLLASVLVDFSVVVGCSEVGRDRGGVLLPQLLDMTLTWLVLSQTNLIAVWLALGWPSGPWRLLGTAGALLCWGFALAWLAPGNVGAKYLTDFGIVTASIAGPLLIARLWRLRVIAPEETVDFSVSPARFQFSIMSLLGWMTALAIVLGTMEMLVPFDELAGWLPREVSVLLMFVFNAAVALAAVCVILGSRRPRAFGAGLLVVSFLPGLVTILIASSRGVALMHQLTTLYFYWPVAGLMMASLAVFRVAGYRFARDRKASRAAESTS